MKSALYLMRYVGVGGQGAGVLYLGRGVLLGIDVGEIRYEGTYSESNGQLQVQATMARTSDSGSGGLVTGQPFKKGQTLSISATWPTKIDSGQREISIGGASVFLTFEKIGDLP